MGNIQLMFIRPPTNRAALKLLALGVSLILLILGFLLKTSYDSVLDRAATNSDNLARSLDGQLSQTLRRMESNLHNIAQRIPAAALHQESMSRHRDEMMQILRASIENFPEIRSFAVWDRNGDNLYHSLWTSESTAKLDIASRDGFATLKNDSSVNLVFSESFMGQIDQQQTLAAYLPLRNDAGELIGVVTSTLSLDYFYNVFKTVSLGEGSVIFVRRSDTHTLVIRHPLLIGEVNKAIRHPIQQRIDAGESGGRDRFKAVVDGIYRIFSFRKLTNYPFYVVVGIPENIVLHDWETHTGFVGLGLAVALLILFLMYRRLRRAEFEQTAARKSTEKAYQVLEEAVENVSAGFTLYDDKDRLLLCNEAYRDMYATSRDLIVPGASFEEIIRKGAERGQYAQAIGRVDEWVAERLKQHQNAHGQHLEMKLDDGRTVLVVEHQTPSGMTVGNRVDITQLKALEAELRMLAMIDTLTGLPNRRSLMGRLSEELQRIRRQPEIKSCVLMVDLDHFKNVNDTYGHAAGDKVLQHFAAIVKEELRVTDHGGRIGGEEFGIFLPNSTINAVRIFAERLRARMEHSPIPVEGQEVYVTISIGISDIRHGDVDSNCAIKRADVALYHAKNSGRNQVTVEGEAATLQLFS